MDRVVPTAPTVTRTLTNAGLPDVLLACPPVEQREQGKEERLPDG